MQVKPIKTRIFKEKENLASFVCKYVRRIPEKSVLVVTSKIVALSEGRTAAVLDEKHKESIIKQESNFAIKTKFAWLTLKDGMILASAGVDESNANGKLVLLPKDSWRSAKSLRLKIMKKFGLKTLGVLITDSRLAPLRKGALGIALGYAGLEGLRDYKGKKDIFGRELMISRTNVADALATAAVLSMGEGDERQPLALIRNAPVIFTNKQNKDDLIIPLEDDLYVPFFARFKNKYASTKKKNK